MWHISGRNFSNFQNTFQNGKYPKNSIILLNFETFPLPIAVIDRLEFAASMTLCQTKFFSPAKF